MPQRRGPPRPSTATNIDNQSRPDLAVSSPRMASESHFGYFLEFPFVLSFHISPAASILEAPRDDQVSIVVARGINFRDIPHILFGPQGSVTVSVYGINVR